MDPFSIVVGIGSLVQMSIQLGKCLKNVYEAAATFEEEIEFLMREVRDLDSVNKSLSHLYQKATSNFISGQPKLSCEEVEVWENTVKILQECIKTAKRLKVAIETIIKNRRGQATRKRDVIIKHLRKQAKEGELNQIQLNLSTLRGSLNISLTLLNLIYNQRGSTDIQIIGSQLHMEIASLHSRLPSKDTESLHEFLPSATTMTSNLPLNQHFDTPRTVSTIYTGRQAYLDALLQAYNSSYDLADDSPVPKRFVVFGMGGSGKTQFCCKFASDNKQRFWGIFTVDASSPSNAQQSFIAIAKACGTEPNERAAKSWLSCSDKPWLLLIDSADDISMDIESYFPNGEQGLTLVTTRNPSFKMHGTIGQQAFHFEGLNDREANELLLKAAGYCEPWTPETIQLASAITIKVGALPLALVHAGKAIKAKYCDINSYIQYYEQSWQLIRQGQRNTDQDEDDPEYMDIFSFFHHENIPFDILIAAIKHPRIEREAEAQEVQEILDQALEYCDNAWHFYYWRIRLSKICKQILKKQLELQYLPTFLRDAELSPVTDHSHVRLREALHLLTRLSLITEHDSSDNYSMHPLVHTWVRERPQMTVRDQAVWCEVAMHTLSRSILLPPLDEAVDPHASLTTKVLPHIISLRNFQRNIESTFMHNREKRNKAWPVPDSVLSPSRTVFLVKSAVVFSKCGEFEKAEQTLRDVMRLYHPLLRILDFRIEHVILAASDCLWEQCRINEAANLREQAFNVVLQDFGPDHPETLWLMGILGESRFEQGLFAESIEILTKAMVGMKKLSDSNSDTFHVHEQLGTRLRACSRLEDAKICHETAVAGFKRCLGENDERTLIATEELAKTYKALGTQEGETNEEPDREYLQAAYKHASFVVEQRKKLLGNDHPRAWRVQRTLCNVRAAMGQVDEAERMYSLIVPLAAHQLGENHLDVIRLKNHQAYILLLQNRYHEVETILLDISKLERYYRASSTGEHPERWDALLGLVECYQKQGKIDSSLAICKKLLMAMGLNQQGRPQKDTGSAFSGMVLSKTAELLAMKNSSVSDNSTSVIPQSQ